MMAGFPNENRSLELANGDSRGRSGYQFAVVHSIAMV